MLIFCTAANTKRERGFVAKATYLAVNYFIGEEEVSNLFFRINFY